MKYFSFYFGLFSLATFYIVKGKSTCDPPYQILGEFDLISIRCLACRGSTQTRDQTIQYSASVLASRLVMNGILLFLQSNNLDRAQQP